MKYRNYQIEPKKDFPKDGFLIDGKMVKKGWIVTDGYANIMPGATWFQTVQEAKEGIQALYLSKGNSKKFWDILKDTQSYPYSEENKYHEIVAGSSVVTVTPYVKMGKPGPEVLTLTISHNDDHDKSIYLTTDERDALIKALEATR